jgi:hypothetical protein
LRNDEVGLEAHLTGDRGEHFAGLRAVTGEESTFEQNFQEDLGVTEKVKLARCREKVNIATTNKVPTVESKGVPGIVGSTTSAAAMVCDDRRATASCGENPASAKRARMAVTLSVGSGTVRSGAAATGGGRPNMNWSWGAPGQLEVPTAPARWTLNSKQQISHARRIRGYLKEFTSHQQSG